MTIKVGPDEKRFQYSLSVALTDEQAHYLYSAARIRRISVQRMLARMIQVIATDHLVENVLDDASKQPLQAPGEVTKGHYHGIQKRKRNEQTQQTPQKEAPTGWGSPGLS